MGRYGPERGMKLHRWINGFGLALLACAFFVSIGTVANRARIELTGKKKILRFAHWRLEGPTIAGYEAVAQAYMARYPDVVIEQMPIPLRVWPMWVRSQLTGDTAPDMIMYHRYFIDDSNLARHFVPLGNYLGDPNPYNAGTPLDGVPWRLSFIGDLSGSRQFNENLIDVYGLPTSRNSMRLFINLDLFAAIAGPGAEPPRDFRGFLALADKTRAYGRKLGFTIVPLAGSKDRGALAMRALLTGLTQSLVSKLDWNFDLSLAYKNGDPYFGYKDGTWNLWDPELKTAFAAVGAIDRTQTRGHMQRMQDEATFQFLQGRALMVPVYSIDAENLVQRATFQVGILGRLPQPDPGDPEYGRGSLGKVAEGGGGVGLTIALSNSTRHPEVALDFLRFATSYRMNELFTRISRYQPAIDGVPPPVGQEKFAPDRDGYPAGIPLLDMPSVMAAFTTHFHLLSARDGGVDAFIASLEGEMTDALQSDLRKAAVQQMYSIQRTDCLIPAYGLLKGEEEKLRFHTLLVKQNEQENNAYRVFSKLD